MELADIAVSEAAAHIGRAGSNPAPDTIRSDGRAVEGSCLESSRAHQFAFPGFESQSLLHFQLCERGEIGRRSGLKTRRVGRYPWEFESPRSHHHSPVAQLAEQPAVNRLVAGSSPARGANTGVWCNGSTSVSGTENLGSNPGAPAISIQNTRARLSLTWNGRGWRQPAELPPRGKRA